jgi:hypothetical protein
MNIKENGDKPSPKGGVIVDEAGNKVIVDYKAYTNKALIGFAIWVVIGAILTATLMPVGIIVLLFTICNFMVKLWKCGVSKAKQEILEKEMKALNILRNKIISNDGFGEDSKLFRFGKIIIALGKTGKVGLFDGDNGEVKNIIDMENISKITKTEEKSNIIVNFFIKDFNNPNVKIEVPHYDNKEYKDEIRQNYTEMKHLCSLLKKGVSDDENDD